MLLRTLAVFLFVSSPLRTIMFPMYPISRSRVLDLRATYVPLAVATASVTPKAVTAAPVPNPHQSPLALAHPPLLVAFGLSLLGPRPPPYIYLLLHIVPALFPHKLHHLCASRQVGAAPVVAALVLANVAAAATATTIFSGSINIFFSCSTFFSHIMLPSSILNRSLIFTLHFHSHLQLDPLL